MIFDECYSFLFNLWLYGEISSWDRKCYTVEGIRYFQPLVYGFQPSVCLINTTVLHSTESQTRAAQHNEENDGKPHFFLLGCHAASLDISSVCLGVQIKECAIFLLTEMYPESFIAAVVVSRHSCRALKCLDWEMWNLFFLTFVKVTSRKFKSTCVLYIIFQLDIAILEPLCLLLTSNHAFMYGMCMFCFVLLNIKQKSSFRKFIIFLLLNTVFREIL